MLALTPLTLVRVDSANALFQTEETLVDLGALRLAIFIILFAVGGALTASQVDQQKSTALFDTLFLNFDLANGMRSRTSVITLGRMRGAQLVTLVDQLQNLLFTADELFHQALNHNFLVFVLHKLQCLMVVQQVIHFATVDFVHGHRYCEIPLVLGPVTDASIEQISNSQLL